MRQITKVVVTTISLSLALTLSSCGSGPNAETRNINRVTDGAEAVIKDEISNLRVSNLLLVATEDGSAVVVGHIVNRSTTADEILGITVGGIPAVISGETRLLENQPLYFEGEMANIKAVFPTVGAVPGRTVELTIGFARAGLVKVNAIIRDKRDIYANITTGSKLQTPTTTE